MSAGSLLVPLQLQRAREDAALLEYGVRTTKSSLYLHCRGPGATCPPTLATLDYLVHCLEPSAKSNPRCNVVPLLPFLGWTEERVAEQLTDVEEVVAAAEPAQECHALVDSINDARKRAGLPSVNLTVTAGHAATAAAACQALPDQQQGGFKGGAKAQLEQHAQRQEEEQSSSSGLASPSHIFGDWPHPELQFSKVAVGGTFDRLHAGHRLLLAATALVAKHSIFVGITADQLLVSKRDRGLLESYADREAAAVGYMRLVNPSVRIVPGPLTDPKEPPLCAVDPEFDAIVVSEETVPGAHAINQTRAELGFPPVVIIVVGLLQSQQHGTKLSSTDLRHDDAARLQR